MIGEVTLISRSITTVHVLLVSSFSFLVSQPLPLQAPPPLSVPLLPAAMEMRKI